MSIVLTTRVALVLFASALAPASSSAGDTQGWNPPDWANGNYGYVANNEPLRSILHEFGSNLEIPVVVSSNIDIVARDGVPATTAEGFLAELHARYGLTWIFDGVTLYIYDGAESDRQTVDYPFARREAFKSAIRDAGIQGISLNWVFLPAENQLQLSGPPRFVQWASSIAGKLADEASWGRGLTPEEDLDYIVRIFKFEYGYVDETYNDTGVANLAEMIANLMNVAHVSQVIGIDPVLDTTPPPPKLRGTGIIAGGRDSAPSPVGVQSRVTMARGVGHEAFVVAYPRLNAVIVRDRSYRMPVYESLIKELDSPVDQIALQVSVLDIDASAAEEFRLDLSTDSLQVNTQPGANGNNFYYAENQLNVEGIALRIRALQSTGKSRMLTRPSVTTLDNQEASFQNNRTFYVRLGGNDAESVDLAPVSYGWVVRIRPHIIYQGDVKSVQMDLHIEDGNRGGADQAVTDVPETSQNIIETQAVVREGNSLLIGGYTVREQARFEQRLPLLGRIPVMGRLFSSKANRDQSLARYFLITPKILPATISYKINSGIEKGPIDTASALSTIDGARPTGQTEATAPDAR